MWVSVIEDKLRRYNANRETSLLLGNVPNAHETGDDHDWGNGHPHETPSQSNTAILSHLTVTNLKPPDRKPIGAHAVQLRFFIQLYLRNQQQ